MESSGGGELLCFVCFCQSLMHNSDLIRYLQTNFFCPKTSYLLQEGVSSKVKWIQYDRVTNNAQKNSQILLHQRIPKIVQQLGQKEEKINLKWKKKLKARKSFCHFSSHVLQKKVSFKSP